MKFIYLTALLLCGVLSSCSRYQINVISSTDGVKDPKTGDFQFENDSIQVSYAFGGLGNPVIVSVYNKLNKPLYVDWQKSALVLNGVAVIYVADNIAVNGEVDARTSSYAFGRNRLLNSTSYTTAAISAVANVPQHATFLPPQSQGSNNTINLNGKFLLIPDTALKQVKLSRKVQGLYTAAKAKSASFNPLTSPLVFKSFLTVYVVNGNDATPASYQHDFFVSRSVITSAEPVWLDEFANRRDHFILEETVN